VAVALPQGARSGIQALIDRDSGLVLPAQPWNRDGRPMLSWIVPLLRAGSSMTLAPREVADARGPEVRLEAHGEGQLSVHLGDQHFTTYNHGPSVVRPYFYPIYAEGEVGVTRNWPMVEDAPGETNDHPHHKGMYTAQGEVNGVDNWGEREGRQIHREFERVFSGPVDGGFVENIDWTDGDGKPNMSERRVVRFYAPAGGLRLVDYTVTLIASEGRVVLGDTKEAGLLSVRVATSMDAANPRGGRITNAFGGIGEAETWGKPSPWCDYSGPVGGEWYGILVMDHPDNPRHPTPWHVRDYGLMTANCFGYHHFTGDDSNRHDLVLEAGRSLTWNYRVLIHRGTALDTRAADHYANFATPPTVTVDGAG
jgi:hypothetical protein